MPSDHCIFRVATAEECDEWIRAFKQAIYGPHPAYAELMEGEVHFSVDDDDDDHHLHNPRLRTASSSSRKTSASHSVGPHARRAHARTRGSGAHLVPHHSVGATGAATRAHHSRSTHEGEGEGEGDARGPGIEQPAALTKDLQKRLRAAGAAQAKSEEADIDDDVALPPQPRGQSPAGWRAGGGVREGWRKEERD